jgi:hypothetical protein
LVFISRYGPRRTILKPDQKNASSLGFSQFSTSQQAHLSLLPSAVQEEFVEDPQVQVRENASDEGKGELGEPTLHGLSRA